MIAYLSPQSSYYEGVGKIGNKRKDAKEVFLPASPEVKDDDGDGGDVEGTSNDSHRKMKSIPNSVSDSKETATLKVFTRLKYYHKKRGQFQSFADSLDNIRCDDCCLQDFK